MDGGNGFLISTPLQRTSRRFITEVAIGAGVARRGLARAAYTGTTLRDYTNSHRRDRD